jgi:arginase
VDVAWTLVGAPLNSSAQPGGEELAPAALRAARVVERLNAHDAGDIDGRIGPAERDAQSGVLGLPGLLRASRELRDVVARLLRSPRRPLVLGGDCTLLLGVGAALQRHLPRPGLWFVDGHTDTFDSANSPTGEAADMELGALTGHGPTQLTAIADTSPAIAPQRVLVLGHRHRDDLEDPRELDLVGPAITLVDARSVRTRGPLAVGTWAERQLRDRADGVWLHLDLDVLDQEELPAVSYPQPGGLSWDELGELLGPLVVSEHLVGMSIADLQADLDPDGTYARRVVDLLAAQLPRARAGATPAR